MTGSGGGETVLADQWIVDKLAASVDAVSYFDDRVFESMAPDDTPYPYVTYQCRVTQDVNGTGPDARVLTRSEYIVKAVGEYDSFLELAVYARLFDTLFNGGEISSGELVTGGSILTSNRIEEYRQTEPHEGRTIRHLGGVYSVQSQSDPS